MASRRVISGSMPLVAQEQFVYDRSMNVEVAKHRRRYRRARAGPHALLPDGRARQNQYGTGHRRRGQPFYCERASPSPEIGVPGQVLVQGKHRYYSLEGPGVASVLESLSVLAGAQKKTFVPNTPHHLRAARTCYDHIAGTLGVSLHDRLLALHWLTAAYDLTTKGTQALESLGIDIEATRAQRRLFAPPCLDWSERRPHIGGA